MYGHMVIFRAAMGRGAARHRDRERHIRLRRLRRIGAGLSALAGLCLTLPFFF